MNSIWYNALNKSPLSPPPVVFVVAWSILYVFIFLSLILFLKNGVQKKDTLPLVLFGLNLILNFSWTPVFFKLQNPILALVIIFLMILTLLPVIPAFYVKSKAAGILLVPYFLWLLFAAYLNFEIIARN